LNWTGESETGEENAQASDGKTKLMVMMSEMIFAQTLRLAWCQADMEANCAKSISS
jgi:hypothetical protein